MILINGQALRFRDRWEVAYQAAMYAKERSNGDIVPG
jgi:hypothetical protein